MGECVAYVGETCVFVCGGNWDFPLFNLTVVLIETTDQYKGLSSLMWPEVETLVS